jgi:hypothetical protein
MRLVIAAASKGGSFMYMIEQILKKFENSEDPDSIAYFVLDNLA